MLLRFSRKGRVYMAGGAMGAVAAWQWKKRRPRQGSVGPDPAQELRARLDESRAVAAEPAAPADAPPETADPTARRESVHQEARARLDDLKTEKTEEGP